MAPSPTSISRYLDTLALLNQALQSLDELGEGIAAAHLSSVIDIVAAHSDMPTRSRH